MALSSGVAPTREEAPPASQEDKADEIRAVAQNLSDQPVQNSDPSVWAVLTAISKKARHRPQGMHILLNGNEHKLGRQVEDMRFQVTGPAISSSHCKILRVRAAKEEDSSDLSNAVFLKDTSTNGTYLNWVKLRKDSPQAKLQHGDIISFVFAPHDENAYAFVYREVNICGTNGPSLKRKSEDLGADCKRLKGIGIGAPDGPISLDDVRSLQRSNTELRQQVELHVHTIETMRAESRTIIARHENDLKELKEKISSSYLNEIKELQHLLEVKQKENQEVNVLLAELRRSSEDLNETLRASMQSRSDADQIIQSQKASISELEAQLDEERSQRRVEREEAEADLKSALQKAHLEAQDEIKRQADGYLRQQKEQQDVITKLQDSEKENRILVETLRTKLEDARESLIMSEKKVRQLEVQVQDEQTVSANWKNKSETTESELRKLRKELENEKVAREEAWSKVSALELEIAAAVRDLSIEKQRFQGARERIILRETQLRAFYSTTEEISALFTRQQEQLKSMQKTLEDEENSENKFVGVDLNIPAAENIATRTSGECRGEAGAASPANDPTNNESTGEHVETDDEDSVTEKHDCDANTQDIECTSSDKLPKGFGSEIDGSGTERVLGTESPSYVEKTSMQKCNSIAEETMLLDEETQVEENIEPTTTSLENMDQLQKSNAAAGDTMQLDEETQIEENADPTKSPVKTADLLASEAVGSWAVSTAPSVNGENSTPRSQNNGEPTVLIDANANPAPVVAVDSDGEGSESQTNNVTSLTKLSGEQRALNYMIGIVAPEFKQQFHEHVTVGSSSDTETEGNGGSDGSNGDDSDNEMDDENETMIEDSVG